MTTQNLTKLTQKYSPQEITLVAKVLMDVLELQSKEKFKSIDPKEEFTPSQIKRLQKQLRDHEQGKAKYFSLTEVSNVLGL